MTLETDNLLWLKARTRATGTRSISAVLDGMVTGARQASEPVTSVVGFVSFPDGEDGLERGTEEIRKLFGRSLSRPSARRQSRG